MQVKYGCRAKMMSINQLVHWLIVMKHIVRPVTRQNQQSKYVDSGKLCEILFTVIEQFII